MPHLKTNWLYDLTQEGFLLLLALLLTAISFYFYECQAKTQKLIAVLLIIYLFCLLLKKYRQFALIIIASVLFFGLRIYHDQKVQPLILNKQTLVKIFPDQVKIKDNWLYGKGETSSGTILLAGNVSGQEKKLLLSGNTILLGDFEGEAEEILPATNIGEFNYRHYYAGKKIFQRLKFKTCKVRQINHVWPAKLHYYRFALQQLFAHMPRMLGFFSSELILAENPHSEDRQVLDNYRDLGVIHLLSISGLHVGIYTLVITTLCFWLKITDEKSFFLCLLVLLVGIWLSAGQAGFIRASLTYLLGRLLGFKKIPIAGADLLGLTCLLHICFCPRLFMSASAILSYVLVLGLQMTNQMSKFMQSCLLNLLLTPLLLFYFFQFNFLTVLFNLLVVPYFNWLVMPIVFFNLLIYGKSTVLSNNLEMFLTQTEKIIGQIAQTKLGLFTFGQIKWWQCLLLLFLTAFFLLYLNEKKPVLKCRLKLSLLWLIPYFLFFLTIHFPLQGQVTFIDVGQGDSILITTPLRRHVYMIDTGGKLNFSGKKITPQVNRITLPFLKAQGINKIDGLFVSHQDADHVGDIGPLLEQIRIRNLYMADGLLKNKSFQKRIDGKIDHTKLNELLAGSQIKDKGINFQVLYPFKPGPGHNEDSLCLTFCLKNRRWLFTGDLGQEGEKQIAAHYPNIKIDYFKLGHHGSRTASNPDFLRQINPKLVFISAGRNNRFGHPHPETLSTLRKQGIAWASTQDCGMISWYYSNFKAPEFSSFLTKEK